MRKSLWSKMSSPPKSLQSMKLSLPVHPTLTPHQTFLKFGSTCPFSFCADYELVNHIILWGGAPTNGLKHSHRPTLGQKLNKISTPVHSLIYLVWIVGYPLQKQNYLAKLLSLCWCVSLCDTRNILIFFSNIPSNAIILFFNALIYHSITCLSTEYFVSQLITVVLGGWG